LYVVLNRNTGQALGTQYGPGEGIIWMEELECVGSEKSLADCPFIGWVTHDCDHDEDVSITCTGTL